MVQIRPYDSTWPEEFRAIGAALRNAMGDLAIRIDHIGSTSVPGLAAKDVIDVQVTVASLGEDVIAHMSALGYEFRPSVAKDHVPPVGDANPGEWQKLYFREGRGQRQTHIHIRVEGKANQRYALLFRDYLRSHSEAVAAYAELKRRLGAHIPDTATYADVKDPACDLIMIAAEAWAANCDWTPGRTDY